MHPQASFGKPRARKSAPAYCPVDHLKPGRPARNDEERAAHHAEIERRYSEPLKNCSEQRRIAILRRCDLEILCRASDVPEDGGLDWLDIAANHLAFIYRKTDAKIAAILKWRARFTPMVEIDTATKLAKRVIADPRMPNADTLGWRLGLTMERRAALGITTIGGIGSTKAKRAASRKERNNAAKRASRAKAGAASHATSEARTKPWIKLGISRRTYYRKGLNDTAGTETGTAHTKCVVVDAKQCHGGAQRARLARAFGPEVRVSPGCDARRFTVDVPAEFRATMLAASRDIMAATIPQIGAFQRAVVAARTGRQ
jgi:hypothetical protein